MSLFLVVFLRTSIAHLADALPLYFSELPLSVTAFAGIHLIVTCGSFYGLLVP